MREKEGKLWVITKILFIYVGIAQYLFYFILKKKKKWKTHFVNILPFANNYLRKNRKHGFYVTFKSCFSKNWGKTS